MGLAGRGGALQRLPIGIGHHQDVPGTALLRDHRDQSVGPEAHGGHPVGVGHRVKVPAATEIVKSPCGFLSCLHSRLSVPHQMELLLVTRNPLSHLLFGSAVLLVGCGSSTEPGGNPLDCSTTTVTNLGVGQHVVIDASQTACGRLPAAGRSGAEYIYAALSADGQESTNGDTATFQLKGSAPGAAAVASATRASLGTRRVAGRAEAFHAMLRARERALSQQRDVVQFDRGAVASV